MAHLYCLGDSITDCGRIWDNPPFGCGYVRLLRESSREDCSGEISITNCGIDGLTLSGLLSKVSDQAFLTQISNEDVVTVLIGINDIGLMQNTCRSELQKQEMMHSFMHNYNTLINSILARTEKLILMEPFIFPYPQEFSLWIPYVRAMSRCISQLSQKYNVPYILLHDRLNEAAVSQGFNRITTDGIHLTLQGHRILTDHLLPIISSYFS